MRVLANFVTAETGLHGEDLFKNDMLPATATSVVGSSHETWSPTSRLHIKWDNGMQCTISFSKLNLWPEELNDY